MRMRSSGTKRTNPRRRNPDPTWTVEDTENLLRAQDRLRPSAQRWVHQAARANKLALLDAYDALTSAEKMALAKSVREAWHDEGYADRRPLYRTASRHEEEGHRGRGGVSLSHKPTRGSAFAEAGDDVRVLSVAPEEVVVDSTVPNIHTRLWSARLDAVDPPLYDKLGRPTNRRSQMSNAELRAFGKSPLWSDQWGAEDEVVLTREASPPEAAYRANPSRRRNGSKAQARALLASDVCGGGHDDNFYHVTTASRLNDITRHGLVPGKPAKFSKLSDYSSGKVFVSHGLETARIWADYIRDMVDEDEEVVILRIRPEARLHDKVHLDEKGTEDAGCSFYVTTRIRPEHLDLMRENPRRRNPRRRNPSVFDTLSPGTPNAVREQLQRLSQDDRVRLQDELNALDDAAAARFAGMTRLWHGAPASIAEKIRERGFARTKGRRSGFMGSTFEVDNLALFLTENKALAEAFGRSRSGRGEGTEVLEVYADLRQPLDLTVWTKVPKALRALGEKLLAANGGARKPRQEDLFWLIDQPAFMDAVRDLGYDAVRFLESAETVKSLGLARKGEVTVAVLDPARLHVAPPPRGTLGSLLSHLARSRR